jgi:hypothetical protein
MMMRRCVIAGALLATVACSGERPQTVRICRGASCAWESRDVATFRPEEVPNNVPSELERAATAGDADAQYRLGLRYLRGEGGRQDGFAALSWLRRAAESGHVQAQLALGRLYLSGYDTVGQDLGESDRWLTAAASQGDPEAKVLQAEVHKRRQERRDLAPDYWRARYRGWGYWYGPRWYP